MSALYKDLKTILEYFYKWENAKGNTPFLLQPHGNAWEPLTWAEAGQQARKLVAALRAMNVPPGSHVGIFSKNCREWVIADLAIMMGGYVSTPFYPNLTTDQLALVLKESQAKALFVGKLDEWEKVKDGVPSSLPLITFPHYAGNARVTEGLHWQEILNEYEAITESPVPRLEDLWTVLFTSGTTGSPKGVMLPHSSAALAMRNEELNGELKIFEGKEHRFFSYLPLNHIAERVAVESAAIMTGGTISFAESIDSFAKNLQDTQPTLFLAVPRMWSKFQLAVLAKLPQKKLSALLKFPVLSGMIKSKITKSLGLSKARVILTGAAPTPDALKDWYLNLGITLREVYGMTETCGGFTMMQDDRLKRGTVGQPVSNVEVKIEPQTGEILTKAPWFMSGYYNASEKTAEVMDEQGWLHTGDQGEIDSEGFLKITGRISDTFKSSKGKYIVPAPIEWGFAKNEFIAQISVVGMSVPQPLALVVLSEIGKNAPQEKVSMSLRSTLIEVNGTLSGYQKVSTIVVLDEDWTVENNVLTPTMKIKRRIVDQRYQERYKQWHEQKGTVIWEREKIGVEA